jgi:hypothetical protein
MIKVLNYILSHLQMGKKPIFIVGHGRSGTTWVGDTFKQAPGAICYHEPCNPKVVKEGDHSHWFRYARPDKGDPYFEACLDNAFKGLLTNRRYLLKQFYRRFFPGYRVVVKGVAPLMSLEWVYKRFKPEILFIIRHPCAVALSEINKNTPVERVIDEILKQPDLIEDHLKAYVPVLEKAKTPYEIYGAVWAARNRVIADLIPKYPEWKIAYYEDLCIDPGRSFRDLFDHFNLDWTDKVQKYINRSTNKEKPGAFSTYRVTKNQINKWKKKLTPDEINQVRNFVEPFNLPFYNMDSDWLNE